MKDGIALDPTYGVNPSMEMCYLCLGDKAVVLFGKINTKTRKSLKEAGYPVSKDGEAPHKVILSPEPCEKCAEYMRQGVILISVRDVDTGPNPYRTGGWVVVRDEAIRALFTGEEAERALEVRMAFVADTVWDRVGLPRGEETAHEHQGHTS